MEKDYQKALEVIFVYGYGWCVVKHNICGDRLEILDGMSDSANVLPPEFFGNLGSPPAQAATEAIVTEVPLNEAA